MSSGVYEAQWWEAMPDGRLHCFLCPRHCHLAEGQRGFCFVRRNVSGHLLQLTYGHPAAVQVDPIEKKPLYHFLPGSAILSLGTVGCNLGCNFCQNWDISRAHAEFASATELTPKQVVALALQQGTPSIAFTYNEPTIWGEYVIDIARLAHEHGISTVMVTNGYVTRAAFLDIYRYVDAANVDLKAISEDFYAKATLSHLQPVLDTLHRLRRETSVWFEITNLIIPGMNDQEADLKELCAWILENLGDDVPLHFSAFHPDYKLLDRSATPSATLHRARALAMEMGVKFVYEGNIRSEVGGTLCPGCRRTVIQRSWHSLIRNTLHQRKCPSCGEVIPGVFSADQAEARRKAASSA